MGCNAWNHPANCRCGWGGDGHKGKSPGGWRGGRGSSGIINSSHSVYSDTEIDNRATTCPKCGGDVFFIRHNGGSVWLDPPLSPPWYKHPCFDYEARGSGRRKLLDGVGGREIVQSISTKILVIDSCVFSPNYLTTKLKGRLDDGELYTVTVKGDGRRLAGRLCFINGSTKELWPHENSDYRFICQGTITKVASSKTLVNNKNFSSNAVDKKVGIEEKGSSKQLAQFPCKLCRAVCSSEKNYRKHLNKVHGAVELCLIEGVGGYLIICESKFYGCGESDGNKLSLDVENEKSKQERSKVKVGNYSFQDPLFSIIISAIESAADHNGWANLSKVAQFLYQQSDTFNVREYGFKNLSLLFKSLDYVEVDELPMESNLGASVVYVRRS